MMTSWAFLLSSDQLTTNDMFQRFAEHDHSRHRLADGLGRALGRRQVHAAALDATDGQILHQGCDVMSLPGSESRSLRANCAMIFKQFNLFPKDDIHRTIDILERFGIAGAQAG